MSRDRNESGTERFGLRGDYVQCPRPSGWIYCSFGKRCFYGFKISECHFKPRIQMPARKRFGEGDRRTGKRAPTGKGKLIIQFQSFFLPENFGLD
jgi:hypothetical protein